MVTGRINGRKQKEDNRMPKIGVQMMMLKQHVERLGPYATLKRVADIGFSSVEVSQIPMTPEVVNEIARARDDLGVQIAAISATVTEQPGVNEPLDTRFDKIVADCHTLQTRSIRIGMMPHDAMRSAQALTNFCAMADEQARRLADEGIQLYYHNHHIEFAKRGGVYILDHIREQAPNLRFEIDVHWVQRGGEHPQSVLKNYAGLVDLVHLKDYRIGDLPEEAFDAVARGDQETWQVAWTNVVQFGEVGEGNLDWRDIIDTAIASGAEHLLIEQDRQYGRDPLECLTISYHNLLELGYGNLM
ncbi:MAG TPA: sugar phosphate isomerase/epimerase [Propionibacteriaceae bacterium]|nr:sugar phosphate isomerase/epimerase [Propionibacteriaceae bacterium]